MSIDKSELLDAKEEFIKLLPIIPVWLTLIGAASIYLKYIKFGVNIFDYLDLQEILTLFLNDIFYLLFLGNMAIFLYSTVFDEDNKPLINLDRFLLWAIFSNTIPILLVAYIFFLIQDQYLIEHKYITLLSFIFGILSINIFFKATRKISSIIKPLLSQPVYKVYRFYIFFTLFVLALTYIRTIRELSKEFHNEYDGSIIITDNSTININPENSLIGKTRNYIFIYTKYDGCVTTIPLSQVKNFFSKKNSLTY